jgi:hypothetical protein
MDDLTCIPSPGADPPVAAVPTSSPAPSARSGAGRRHALRVAGGLGLAVGLAGCAGLRVAEPLRVSLVGLEPLAGQGLEWRFLVKLRVLNPNPSPVEYDGGFVAMSVRGSEVASGVLGEAGRLPGYGDTVVSIPMSVTALGVVRPLLGLAGAVAGGDASPLAYALRGSLSTGVFGRIPFAMSGEVDMRSLFGRPGHR